MTFWNLMRVARDLKENKVTEVEKANALIYLTLLLWLSVPTLVNLKWLELRIFFGPGVLITIFGIIWCFWANAQGDNQDFIGRMVCLSWLIGTRMLIIALIISIVISIMPKTSIIYLLILKHEAVLNSAIGDICFALFFVWVRHYILYVSGARRRENGASRGKRVPI